MLKYKAVWHTVFVLALLAILLVSRSLPVSESADTLPHSQAVLIDAGHGGFDGGTTAIDGTLEKDINLAIALDLRDVLRLLGVTVEMTREQDESIHDEGCDTVREKKVSDMVNRLAMYDAAAMTVSIHQNHFSASKYNGAQLFYSPSHPVSMQLTNSIRQQIVSLVQPDNKREPKQVSKDVFLLHKTVKPAVLVECGFLSNPQDNEALKTQIYQQKMALAIAVGILDVYTAEE